MTTDDLIPGQVRVVRETTQEARIPVLKDIRQQRVNYSNPDSTGTDVSRAPSEQLFINAHHALVGAPSDAETRRAPAAEFFAGETLIVQHKANAGVPNPIELEDDTFSIGVVERDNNTGESRSRDLTSAQQELTGTATEQTDQWVDIYQFTVPDETQFALAGSFEAVAQES